jgi:hypothetical protein
MNINQQIKQVKEEIEENKRYIKIYIEKFDKSMSNRFKNNVLKGEAKLETLESVKKMILEFIKNKTEQLSEIEHNQWVEWSKEIAIKGNISNDRLKRWKLLWIPYENLSEDIKEQDRVYAKKLTSNILQDLIGET